MPAEIKSTLSEIDVTADMLVKGDRLMDLPLPEDELVVTVKRDDTFFIPNGRSETLSERQGDDHFAQQKKSGHGSPGFQYSVEPAS